MGARGRSQPLGCCGHVHSIAELPQGAHSPTPTAGHATLKVMPQVLIQRDNGHEIPSAFSGC